MKDICLIAGLVCLFTFQFTSSHAEVDLEEFTKENSTLMQDCRENLKVGLSACQCILRQSVAENRADVPDMMTYFLIGHGNLNPSTVKSVDFVKASCIKKYKASASDKNYQAPVKPLLSAGVDRGQMLMDDCQNEYGTDPDICSCTIQKSVEGGKVSNVSLGYFFNMNFTDIDNEESRLIDQYMQQCQGVKSSMKTTSAMPAPPASDADGVVSGIESKDRQMGNPFAENSALFNQCAKQRELDKPACRCMMHKMSIENISSADAKAFFDGKASEVSNMDVYGDIAHMSWTCAQASVRGEYSDKPAAKAKSKAKSATKKGATLPRLANTKWNWQASDLDRELCYRRFGRPVSYCECIVEGVKPYMHQWEYEGVFNGGGLTMSSVPNYQVKYNFVQQVARDCKK